MKKNHSANQTSQIVILITIAFFLLTVTVRAIAKEEEHVGGVDKELCIQCGDCWRLDPYDIVEDSDGKAKVINPICYEQMFKAAESACSVGAIWSNF